jgi:hypothetical protein
MIKVSAFLFWTLAEVALVLFVVLLVLGLYLWWRKRRDYAAAKRLIANVKQAMPQRDAEMQAILGEGYGYAGDRLAGVIAALRKGEMAVYKALLRAYLKRDRHFLTQWHRIFEHAVAPYRSLEVPKGQQKAGTQASEIDNRELEALRKKNQELTDELRVTMDTMGRVLGEYSGMFSREEEEGDDVVLVINEDQIAKPVAAPVAGFQGDIASVLGQAASGDDMDWGTALAEQAAGESEAKAEEDADLDWGAALAEQAAGESEATPEEDADLDWGAALAEQAAGESEAKSEEDADLDWGAALAEQAAGESEAKSEEDADLDWGAALAEQAAGESEAKSEEDADLDWGAALAEQAAGESDAKTEEDADLDWGAALAEQAAGESGAKPEEDDDLDWGAALAEQAAAEVKSK